jgi:hypothetical protein
MIITEELVTYDPELRKSWKEGGNRPQGDHYHFHEAVVAAHFIMQGYQVLRHYNATAAGSSQPMIEYANRQFHHVIGPDVSACFRNEVAKVAPTGADQLDLFVFRQDTSNDPHMRCENPRLWFPVEVNGLGGQVIRVMRSASGCANASRRRSAGRRRSGRFERRSSRAVSISVSLTEN